MRSAGAGRRPTRDAVEMSGRLLARLDRGRGADDVDNELRVALDEYQGTKFVRVGVWARGPDGWVPLRGKSVTIRRGELADVQAALREAAKEFGGDAAPTKRSGRPDRSQWADNLPPAGAPKGDHDEL
jgi:hypothetical protein